MWHFLKLRRGVTIGKRRSPTQEQHRRDISIPTPNAGLRGSPTLFEGVINDVAKKEARQREGETNGPGFSYGRYSPTLSRCVINALRPFNRPGGTIGKGRSPIA